MTRNALLGWLFFTGIIFFSSCSFAPRSKEDIYTVFFGEEKNGCVQILNSRDTRALDDPGVWIHFKACPDEIKRILLQVPYKIKRMSPGMVATEFTAPSQIDEDLISTDPPKWWDIKKLGDSCFKFEYFHPDKDYAQFAYVSPDSTEVFYHDSSW